MNRESTTVYNITIFFIILSIILVPESFSSENINILDNVYEYRLGPDDVVSISVEYIPEISKNYTVSDRGEIVFPTLLPTIKAKGLTVIELRNLLTEILKEYIIDPKVSVNIAEYHSHKVLILGPFQKPGLYKLKREKIPIIDLITETGGLSQINENDELVILRNPSASLNKSESNQTIRINLKKLILDGDITQNIMIETGDIISLESFFTSKKNIYIVSAGQSTGIVPYEPGLTVFTALIKAGIKLDSSRTYDLSVIRKDPDSNGFSNAQVKLDPANPSTKDMYLQPEDIIMLPDVSTSVINVIGEVNKRGAVPYKEGITVFDAIQAAGGMTNKAVGNKVRVLRKNESGREQILVNVNAILENWDKAQDIVLMPGDIILVPEVSLQEDIMVNGKVNNPKIVPYEPGMTTIKAILLAGGLSNNALNSQIRIIKSNGDIIPTFTLDISQTKAEDVGLTNPILSPGDLIMVLGPSPGNNVILTGKVQKQGIIDYEEGLTVFGAIMKAGGFAQGAAKSKVTIIRGEGKQQKNIRVDLSNLENDRSKDIPILPGDIIRIPESLF